MASCGSHVIPSLTFSFHSPHLGMQFRGPCTLPAQSSYQTYHTFRSFYVLSAHLARDQATSSFQPRKHHLNPRHTPTNEPRRPQGGLPCPRANGNRFASCHPHSDSQ